MRYRLGPHRGGGVGPESRKHCWGQRRSHRRVVQNSWVTERGGGWEEVVVKPNTAGGSVSPSKVDQSLYTTTWQSNIVGPFTPRETRNLGRRGWWAVSRVGYFFLPKVGLKSRNNGLSCPTGVVPTACNSWCIHRLCLMGECASA